MDLGARIEVVAHDYVMPEPFADFFRRERAGAIALSYSLCGDRSVAEELVQDAMSSASAQWDVIGRLESPSGWLRRVVANRSVSHIRRRITEAKLLVRLQSDRPRTIEIADADAELWALVRKLPRRQAQVIALKSLSGMSLSEIGEVLGISKETAQTHAERARATLAAQLRERP